MKKIVRWILGLVTIVSMYFIYETDQLNSLSSSVSIPSNVQHTTISNEGPGLITSGAYELFLKDNMVLSGIGLSVIGYKRVFGTSGINTGSDEYQKSLSGYNIYSIKSDLGIIFQIDPFNTRLWYNEGWDDYSKKSIIVEQNDRIITAYESGNKNEVPLIDIVNIPFSGNVEESLRNTIPNKMQNKCIVKKESIESGYQGNYAWPDPLGADRYGIVAADGLDVCTIQMDDGCFNVFELCGDFVGGIDGASILYSANNKIFFQGIGQDTRRTKDYGSNIIE